MSLLEQPRFWHPQAALRSNPASRPTSVELAALGLLPVWQGTCAVVTARTVPLLSVAVLGFCSLPIAVHTLQSFGDSSIMRAPLQLCLLVVAQACLSIAAQLALSWFCAYPVDTSFSIRNFGVVLVRRWTSWTGLVCIRVLTTLVGALAALALALLGGLASSSIEPAATGPAEFQHALIVSSIDQFVLGFHHPLSGRIDELSRSLPSLLWGDSAPFSDALKWKIYQQAGNVITPGPAAVANLAGARLLCLGLIVCCAVAGIMETTIGVRIHALTSATPALTIDRRQLARKGAVGFATVNLAARLFLVLGVSIPITLSAQLVHKTISQSWGTGPFIQMSQWLGNVTAVLIGAFVVMLRILYMSEVWRRLAGGCDDAGSVAQHREDNL
jgi:hypothetical protein